MVNHVVGEGNLAVLVANDGERDLGASNLIDILDPALVGVDGVGRETNQLGSTLGELWLELREGTELGGADGSVVLGVREEDNPLVANPLVEVDGALGGLGLEVGGNCAQADTCRRLVFCPVFQHPGVTYGTRSSVDILREMEKARVEMVDESVL